MTGAEPTVLVVDDERNIRRVLRAMLKRAGYEVTTAADGNEALNIVEEDGPFDVVITDLKMPGMDGMDLLRALSDRFSEIPVVMITAHGSVGSAVEAVKLGAFDYIEKPFERDQILQVANKAVRTAEASQTHARPSAAASARFGIVGSSAAIDDLYAVIDRVADTPSTILISGESGTGKELVAKALHVESSRKDKPFIRVNCAAIPHDLIESELFGHEKGAFTGAVNSKPGRFELAHEGTLLLDEVGDIPFHMQAKLLRAIQESEFERVGGIRTIKVNVRIIAATNRDLHRDIEEGRFREDLFYRLNVVPIAMTPLRERSDDIALLVQHFVERFNERLNRSIAGFTPDAIELMKRYRWPGNIRELENVVERTMLFCDGVWVHANNLPDEIRLGAEDSQPPDHDLTSEEADAVAQTGGATDLKQAVRSEAQKVARRMITQALQQTGGNITQAAKVLGLSRKGLQVKMKELRLRQDSSQDTPETE
ncbi:MAG: sigma-54-dependent Fis family transcriptional regulator [Deltaproteobacteria bacterium]|nr:sigma-54-dependent Fis family transcriptional regulator [Deltaproteobacteria bacterium]